MPYTLTELNHLSQADFINAFGGIFEHSPWVAEQVYHLRPFTSVNYLRGAMQAVVDASSRETRLALICAHPELRGKLAPVAVASDTLTAESRSEQESVGLDRCTPEELVRLQILNDAYRQRFGFPFVIAVRGLTRQQIVARMEARLNNEPDQEFDTCLAEIAKIAGLRLNALTIT